INFDAFGFLERFCLYAKDLQKFLRDGKYICWGVVPTQELNAAATAEELRGKVLEGINILAGKGLEKNLALDQLLLSPACGLGSLDTEKAGIIFRLLEQTSALFLGKK
ncbi:MAG: hypothetical protein Q8N85_02840, partial [Candidatus Omnitrophota bacterium]|nr:hypothetical protein [Candidatus Omnitrophota bacterium]